MLQLFQAEWCPFSSRVRERLTELGLDVHLRQVAPWPEEREELVAATGQDGIPALLADDGTVVCGADEIVGWLEARHEPWRFEAEHRQRFVDHRR